MRRFFLISFGILFGSVALLAGYVLWDYDPDDTPPMVSGTSYQTVFENVVLKQAGQPWKSLDDNGRLRTVTAIMARRDGSPAREVALARLRELRNQDAGIELIRKSLTTMSDEEFEAAIGTVAAANTAKSKAMLDALHTSLDADPASHTPLGGYRNCVLTVKRADPDLALTLDETSRLDADYTLQQTPQIALFLPQRPDLVLAVPNVDDVLEDFNDSRFAKALDESPVGKDAWSLPVLRTLGSLRSRLDETMGSIAPLFSPERLFKDYLLLARYGDNYLAVCFKDKNVSVGETMIDVFGKLGADFSIERRQVAGLEVRTIANRRSRRTLNYATVDGYFIAATDTALIGRALRTYAGDHGASFAIDPLFARTLGSLDPSGAREVAAVWWNPTREFEVTGSTSSAARRLAVVARALGRPAVALEAAPRAEALAGALPTGVMRSTVSGDPMPVFWRYVLNVRSLGKNPVDSLAKLAKVDIAKGVMPYLSSSIALGYGGVEYLPKQYHYANTSYDVVAAFPLLNPPADFEKTVFTLLSRTTTLLYTPEQEGATKLWIARDTTTNDSAHITRKFQPSFAIVSLSGGSALVVAATPDLLRRSVRSLASASSTSGGANSAFFKGAIRVDSLAANGTRYLRNYLVRTDRYTPQEIDARLPILRNALDLYTDFVWGIEMQNGLRHGEGRLIAKR